MRKVEIIFAIASFISIFYFPGFCRAQNSGLFAVNGKINAEYRDNIGRKPNALRKADLRSTMFLYAAYRHRSIQRGSWAASYELRNYLYAQHQQYQRHDHILFGSWQNANSANLKVHMNDEFSMRFYPYSHFFNYRRNIFNIYTSRKIPYFQRFTLGYKNWIKTYPNETLYQNYSSHRIYIKLSGRFAREARFGIKCELQQHRGTLYPGSTAPGQVLNQDGDRFVLQLFLDKVMNRKVFSNISYKMENDIPDSPDYYQTGENRGDENSEELLAEDADFGYLKHQVSLSTLFKINSRVSFMIFYLAQMKHFHYWRVSELGPKRKDRLVFLSNVFKYKIYKDLGLELHYNFEQNSSNLGFYQYQMNSISLGIFYQP